MEFINDNFLLSTETGRKLYHDYAKKMPIVDYHCHLSPKDIAEDRCFENITQLWLYGDHYKWRLMRNCGIEEKYISGDGTDKEKFLKWAITLEKCIGNPVYHWSALELARYFDWKEPLTENAAETCWEHCNRIIFEKKISAREIIVQSKVEVLCTTDNPEDKLQWHKQIKEDTSFSPRVLPAFRPDRAFKFNGKEFAAYIGILENRFGIVIRTYTDFRQALYLAIEYFDSLGCRTSDHGLDYVPYRLADEDEIKRVFHKAMQGSSITKAEYEIISTKLLYDLAKKYREHNWVMQLHYGASRNNNQRAFLSMGPDMGFDSISRSQSVNNLPAFMDMLEKEELLPKIIIYPLDSADNVIIDTICGCYHETGVKGKVQHGSAWWFNDNYKGIIEQLEGIANNGVLSNFVGMLTDSRSFLSYTRHEYFRRILCELLGAWIEKGFFPIETCKIGKIVQDISYWNAIEYFDLEKTRGNKNENDI